MKTFGEFVLSLAITAFRVWVGIILWGWFFVPLGLPKIGLWHYLGITLWVAVAQQHHWVDSKTYKKDSYLPSLVLSLFVLLVGLAIKHFALGWQ